MRLVTGFRASSVLYSWLICNHIEGTVILPANICETVPATYLKSGLKIKLCDIDKRNFDISEEIIKNTLNEDVKIIHFNHTYGRKDKDQDVLINNIKKEYPQIIIVDDRCLCEPDLDYKGTSADMILYSTGHTKVVNIGKGGFAYISDKWDYIEQVEQYSNKADMMFDKHIKECHKIIRSVDLNIMKSQWINFDLGMSTDEYINKLHDALPKAIEHKRIINEIYSELECSLGDNYNIWRFQLFLNNPIECRYALFRNGLFCNNHFMSLGNGYFSDVTTENCNYLYTHILNLFNDFCYTEEQAEKTVRILKDIMIPL